MLTFLVTLDKAPVTALTVNYQTLTSGTAASGDDFSAAAGTVTFAAGQTVATVSVTVNGDTAFETNETVQVRFSGAALAASVTATGTINNDDTDTSNDPQSLTLTAGTDAFSTTATSPLSRTGGGNDTIGGVLQGAGATGTTVQPGDNIDGGAGTDTLSISVAGDVGNTGYTLSALQTTNVERVTLSNFNTNTNAGALTVVATDLMNGLQVVGLSASSATGDAEFSGLRQVVAAEMRNGAGDLTLAYNASVVAGTADTQNLIVSNLTAGTFKADGAETIAIHAEVTKSTLTDVTSNALKTITVSGAADLTVSTALTAATINASAATGALSVKLGNANQAVTGGAANDTLDASTHLTSADTVAGGAGTDTLKLSVAGTVDFGTAASKGALFNVSGVEVIDVASTNNAATLNLDGLSGVTTVVAAANTKTVTFSTAAVNNTAIAFTLNGVAQTTAATDGTATTDEAAALLATKISSIAGFTATHAGSVVTIVSTTGEAIEIGSFSGGMIAANTAVSAYSNLSVTNLAAGQVVDLFSSHDLAASLKDASGTADALTVNLKTLSADKGFDQAIGTLTANNIETITLGATGMADGKIKTVAAVTGNALKTLNITGDSDVTISAFTGSTALVTIDGSTATGDLHLAAPPAAKDQSIKTGAGNDTIVKGAFLTAADTIDGGANSAIAGGTTVGKDLLTASGNIGTSTTAAALKIANVENIEISTGGAAATYIDAAAITGAENIAFSSTSGTVKLTNLAANVKVGLGIGTAESGSTLDLSLANATGTADAISLDYSDSIDASTTNVLTVAAAVETLNVSASKTATGGLTSTLTSTGMAAKNIVITDGATLSNVIAFNTLNAATTNVDGSKYVGGLALTTAATGAVTVSANGTRANALNTGAGADTITLVGKLGTTVQTVAGGAGNDVLNVTADNASTDFTHVTAVETINITVGGNTQAGFNDATKDDGLNLASVVNLLGGDSLSTFTIGTAAVLDDDAAGTTMKFDAAAFGGAIDIHVALDAFDAELSILGGASTTDKVTATISAVDNKIAQMAGVETLVLNSTNNDVSASVDLSNVTGLVTVDAQFINNANLDQIQIDKMAAGVKVKTTSTKTGDNLVVNLASITGTTDTVDLEVTAFGAVNDVLNFDAAGIETLNLSMKNANAGKVDLGGVTATTGSTVSVNVSGTGAVELAALSSSISKVVSTGTGALTIAAADRGASAMAITGGEAGDSIALRNASDVLDGGLGTDTLVVSFGAILGGLNVDLSAADQIVAMNGSSNGAVQTGFENVNLSAFTGFGAVVTGSTGANTIVGTGSADQITSGNGADNVTGGAGDDTIDLTESTAAVDTVVHGGSSDGVDRVTGFVGGAGADALDFNGSYVDGTAGQGKDTNGAVVTYAASAVEYVAADTAALTNSTSVIWRIAETIAVSTAANAIANAVTELNDGAARFAANFSAGEGGLLVMNDGTNSFVFEFKAEDTDGAGADTPAIVEAADLKLVGVFDGLSLFTNAHTDNFA